MNVRDWLKGNTHTHTLRSDGDATVEQALSVYAGAGYDFLVITDHNRYIHPDELPAVGPGRILPIVGSELSVRHPSGNKPVHVCDVGGQGPDAPGFEPIPMDADPAGRVRAAVALARATGGVPIVCHPCWHWALSADDLLAIEGGYLLEVWNASSDCNNVSSGGWDSPEDIWGKLLSAGRRVWAVAADDSHRMIHPSAPPVNAAGQAWVRVGAAERTAPAILEALASGRFYASTGVELATLSPGPDEFALSVQPVGQRRYTIVLLGQDHRELARVHGTEASYRPTGTELFVRARVEDSDGYRCWTQPRFA